MNNKIFFFNKLFNGPFKKCVITKSYYPVLLMQKLAKVNNSHDNYYTYIPDSLYSNVFYLYLKIQYEKSDYIFCEEEILTSELNKTKYPSNFLELIIEDIVNK